ncbi:MAG: hypothetical protein JNJ77_04075 [Planctomycetia bacterium]|nr:hypothetical protein [Planctomycetia bacterium]
MISIANTVIKLYVVFTAMLSDYESLTSMNRYQLSEYVKACYYSCTESKDPAEIDPFVFFGTRMSWKLLKYLDENPSVGKKIDSIKYLIIHMDKESALRAIIININQRDLEKLATLKKNKIDMYFPEYAVRNYIKKSKRHALNAVRIAVRCDYSIFWKVEFLISQVYTEAEVQAMFDEVYAKSPAKEP